MKKDVPYRKAIKAFESFGFFVTSEREHVKLANLDGRKISALPNHKKLKGSTLSEVLDRAGINKAEFFGIC